MTTDKHETKVVTATGFHNGSRLRAGDTFTAPASFKGKWFTTAGEDKQAVAEALSKTFNVLDLSAKEVQERLPSLTSAEINDAISAETGSGKRKNVLAMLRDELSNRVGKLDTADPASKSHNEKDPIVAGTADDLLS